MSKTKQILRNVPTAFKYLLVGLLVAFISFLFPNHVKFKYIFEEGQTWNYEDLKAPFDFPILKSDADKQKDIDAFDAGFSPYYKRLPEKSIEVSNNFEALLNNKFSALENDSEQEDFLKNTEQYYEFGRAVLKSIYNKGLIQLDTAHANKGRDLKVRVIHKNTIEKFAGSFLDSRTATAFIIDTLYDSSLDKANFLTNPLQESLQPNIVYDKTETLKRYEQQRGESVGDYRGMVRKGQYIVRKSDVITDDIYQQLHSLKTEHTQSVAKDKNYYWVWLGYFLLTALILSVFIGFLRLNERHIFDDSRQLIFILMWIAIYSYIVYLVVSTGINNLLYAIPFCIVPVVIKNFHNARLALFTHIVIILIASFLSPLGYEFTFVQILAGIVAILANVRTRYINRFFLSMLYILLVYSLAFFGLSLIKEGSIFNLTFANQGAPQLWLMLNVFLTLLSYPLIPLLERLFGFTSEITLLELSDMDKPLLREMSIKAPGTLQHSLQVANLAEAAAKAIDADSLLVKVAALYHDIGKMKNPQHYIENQNGENPHDKMKVLESAKMIIAHITEGEKMAKKAGLPTLILDFIKTHHGTTRTEYFYRKHIEENPDKEVDEKLFRYPGPKPKTKEEAILMVADSIEAASKSLKNPTEQSINDLVHNIIAGKIGQGQFADSNLSFSELETCKEVFKKLLKSIYHVRIEYPEEAKKG